MMFIWSDTCLKPIQVRHDQTTNQVILEPKDLETLMESPKNMLFKKPIKLPLHA